MSFLKRLWLSIKGILESPAMSVEERSMDMEHRPDAPAPVRARTRKRPQAPTTGTGVKEPTKRRGRPKKKSETTD